MIPLSVPNLNGNEKKYLINCIDTTFVSSVGQYVKRLEELVAHEVGVNDAVATSAGTTALHLALRESGVRRGDLVIAPSFTFIASANAVAHSGATPWLMDIDKANWTLDPDQVEAEIEKNTTVRNGALVHKETGKRVSAILPVYTLGNVADMDAFKQISHRFEVPLIADAACAIGATYKHRKLGGLADASIFSFNGNKTVTAGGGGAVFSEDVALMEKVRHVSTTARVWPEYDFDEVGYNYRMTNLQAAVGCAQLERLDEFVDRKREVRKYYDGCCLDAAGVTGFPVAAFTQSSCWFSGIVLEKGRAPQLRSVIEYLQRCDIDAKPFWKPVHMQIPYLKAPRSASLDVTESLWNRIITLPCSTGITNQELEIVGNFVKKALVDAHE